MVTTEGKRERAALNNPSNVLSHALVDAGHGPWLVDLADVRVGLFVTHGDIAYLLYCLGVELDVPAQSRQLIDQASSHESFRSFIDAGAGLAA